MARLPKEKMENEAGPGSSLNSAVLTEEQLQHLSSILGSLDRPKLVIEYKDDRFLSLGQGPMPLPAGKV